MCDELTAKVLRQIMGELEEARDAIRHTITNRHRVVIGQSDQRAANRLAQVARSIQ